MSSEFLKIGPHVTVAPVVHGSGDFAWEIRRLMISDSFDCLAVPLPESFQTDVEQAILSLPTPSAVFQQDRSAPMAKDWTPERDAKSAEENDFDDAEPETASYVPIDPCQPVIAACLLYTSPSPRDATLSRMPSSA